MPQERWARNREMWSWHSGCQRNSVRPLQTEESRSQGFPRVPASAPDSNSPLTSPDACSLILHSSKWTPHGTLKVKEKKTASVKTITLLCQPPGDPGFWAQQGLLTHHTPRASVSGQCEAGISGMASPLKGDMLS